MEALLAFVVENFWFILAALFMARYNRWVSVIFAVLCATTTGLVRTIGIWIAIVLALGFRDTGNKSSKPTNDPDYD